MTEHIVVKKSNIKFSLLKVENVDNYVKENNLTPIDSVSGMPTFTTEDYQDNLVATATIPEELQKDLEALGEGTILWDNTK